MACSASKSPASEAAQWRSRAARICASGTPHKPQDQDQDDRPKRGGDNFGDDPGADVDPQSPGQPAADKGADDADDDVAEQAEAAAADQRPGQPAGDDADDEPDDKAVCADLNEMMMHGKLPGDRVRYLCRL